MLRYPGSPEPFTLVITWIFGSVVSDTFSMDHQPFSNLLHIVSKDKSYLTRDCMREDSLSCSSFSGLGDNSVDEPSELASVSITTPFVTRVKRGGKTYDSGSEKEGKEGKDRKAE